MAGRKNFWDLQEELGAAMKQEVDKNAQKGKNKTKQAARKANKKL